MKKEYKPNDCFNDLVVNKYNKKVKKLFYWSKVSCFYINGSFPVFI